MQDIESKLSKTRHFLLEYSELWKREVLNYYPDSIESFPKDWIATLKSLSQEELYLIDGKQQYQHLPDSQLKSFIKECRELEELESLPITPSDYPSWAWYGVRGKKKHEITHLLPLIKDRSTQNKIKHFYDIGGGVGHLARILAHYESIETTSVDMNQTLQDKGEIRKNKYPKPETAKNLNFINLSFNQNFHKSFPVNDQTGLLGLHTCGDLAFDFVHNFIKSDAKLAINFGCCYLKINPEGNVNLSKISHSTPLPYTKYALTLATRGHMNLSREEFQFKLKVKKYRYLLHLFFRDVFNITTFISVGDSPPRDYELSFYEYIKLKIQENNLQNNYPISIEQLDEKICEDYFHAKEQEEKFMSLLYCDIIRWQLGRILEIDLLLDRALYAKENGVQAEVYQIFDVHQSPRNIGIILTK